MKFLRPNILVFFLISVLTANAQNQIFGELKISGKDTISGWMVSENDSVFFGDGEKLIETKRGDTITKTRILNYSQRQFYPSKLRVNISAEAPDYFLEKEMYGKKVNFFSEFANGNWTGFDRDFLSGDTLRSVKMTDCQGLVPVSNDLYGRVIGKVKPDCDCQYILKLDKAVSTEFHVSNTDSSYTRNINYGGEEYFEKSKTHWQYSSKGLSNDFRYVNFGSDNPEDVLNLTPSFYSDNRGNAHTKTAYFKKGKKSFMQINDEKLIQVSEDAVVAKVAEFHQKYAETNAFQISVCGTSSARYFAQGLKIKEHLVIDDSIDFNVMLEYQAEAVQQSSWEIKDERNLKYFRLTFKNGKLVELTYVFENDAKTLSTAYLKQRAHPFSFLMDNKVGTDFKHLQKNTAGNWEVLAKEKEDAFSGEIELKKPLNIIGF